MIFVQAGVLVEPTTALPSSKISSREHTALHTVTSSGRERLHRSADCLRANTAKVVVQITPPRLVAEKPFRQSALTVHGVGRFVRNGDGACRARRAMRCEAAS